MTAVQPPQQITLYTAKICPYAHRTELALAELGVDYTRYEIDLKNKPEWYAPKVNSASKVPAIAYGGPKVPADQPSPESIKIAESLVLLEFFADLFPNSTLLPKDPVLRAKARFFIEIVSSKVAPGWYAFVMKGESADALYAGLEAIQDLLPDGKAYAVGDEVTIADLALAPFLARLEVTLKNDIGVFKAGEGLKAYQVFTSDRFAKLQSYFARIKARDSFKKTFDEEYVKEAFLKRFERK